MGSGGDLEPGTGRATCTQQDLPKFRRTPCTTARFPAGPGGRWREPARAGSCLQHVGSEPDLLPALATRRFAGGAPGFAQRPQHKSPFTCASCDEICALLLPPSPALPQACRVTAEELNDTSYFL